MDYDFIIIGTGAAGLSAALYAGRYQMKAIAFGDDFGGYTAVAGVIENYPGNKAVDGFELMQIMKEQAIDAGAEVKDEKVTQVEFRDKWFFATTDKGGIYKAPTILFGTGSKRRQLGLPNENELTSKGVHYCATCDAPMYGGKTIAVVGGGDGAVKGALLGAEYARKVYMLVRGDVMRAEPVNIEHLKRFGDKIEIFYSVGVTEIIGKQKLEKIGVSRPVHGKSELVIDGLFIEIGADPRTELTKPLSMELDGYGFIKTNARMETNISGAYAAGDIADLFGGFKQDITAAAMGSVAATSAYQYIKKYGLECKQ
jgi:thioredoxin reductase (NADPH)